MRCLSSESLVVVKVHTERLSDVYRLDEMKDRFFTLFVLTLLKPNLFERVEAVRNILIKKVCVVLSQVIYRDLGHFIRAIVIEYRINIVTIDGRSFKRRNYFWL
ncbi:hypothetical protein RF11_02707 [Thelohanellus kitauei]|uniref:Uncharacterized protein n=1 Tax=Thelohanellus kitauei TaxID=669202 RepID=A0A0C2MUC7_THEKT|nr:hypothetical protein RF11_02707 [Thelohanellus kitauei]